MMKILPQGITVWRKLVLIIVELIFLLLLSCNHYNVGNESGGESEMLYFLNCFVLFNEALKLCYFNCLKELVHLVQWFKSSIECRIHRFYAFKNKITPRNKLPKGQSYTFDDFIEIEIGKYNKKFSVPQIN